MEKKPIAIVGLGAIYPQAKNIKEFWQNLTTGKRDFKNINIKWKDFLHNINKDDFEIYASVLQRPTSFKYEKYKIPPAHISHVPYIQLLMFQAAEQAMYDAGYGNKEFSCKKTDVICGCCFGFERTYFNTVRVFLKNHLDLLEKCILNTAVHIEKENLLNIIKNFKDEHEHHYPLLANDRVYELATTIAARISIFYKLQGEGFSVESADTTSFKALQFAINNLREEKSDLSIVICAQQFENPFIPLCLNEKGVLTKGIMVPFSDKHDGYNLGEGVGAVVLKRLDDAVASRDKIYAVIRSSAIYKENQKGPFRYCSSLEPMLNSIQKAYKDTNWERYCVQYIECSTPCLGQTLELELKALKEFYQQTSNIYLGSVKELIGNTFANSGLSSLIKTTLSLKNKKIIPQHYSNHNLLQEHDFKIAKKLIDWPSNNLLPRRAAINVYGLGGEFCHLLLEEYKPRFHIVAIAQRNIAKINIVKKDHKPKIAIVGMGGIFPKANNKEKFWENIVNAKDTFTNFPEKRWNKELYYQPKYFSLSTSYCDQVAYVDDEQLDYSILKILPKRIKQMDRTQKIGLLIAHEALKNVKHRSNTAVILASNLCNNNEKQFGASAYLPFHLKLIKKVPDFCKLEQHFQEKILEQFSQKSLLNVPQINRHTLDACITSGVAHNISNYFGFNGQISMIEAACASSLAALHKSFQGLLLHEYDMVLTGGVEFPVNLRELVLAANMRLLAHEKIRPFDARADGFLIGEGGALFALKRYDDALKDGDYIYAIIKSIGYASDAYSFVAPDPKGQMIAMQRAFDYTDISPNSIQYLETHGTGTKVGDLKEIESIKGIYGKKKRSHPLALGSIKAIIGHTWSAAGAAGLLKTALALHNKILPPNTNCEQPNLKLDLKKIPAYLSTEIEKWPENKGCPRRAAVNAFGTGGFDYHVLVEEDQS